MKNLFSVLLITTLAIAYTVAAQETRQDGVEDSAPFVPSMGPKEMEALWDEKYHHYQFKQCPEPLIVTLPIPVSEYECKRKCESGNSECAEACDLGRGKCKATCQGDVNTCKAHCTTVTDCELQCTIDSNQCAVPCNSACVSTCLALPGASSTPGIQGRCNAVCRHAGKPNCVHTCEQILKKDSTIDTTMACPELCNTVPNVPCSDECDQCETSCKTACTTCNDACKTACDVGETACEAACDSGADECKTKAGENECKCKEECKPCEDVCSKACYADKTNCESECMEFIGSDEQCWSRCKRNCPDLCEHSCKRCNAEEYAADAVKTFATDATVSEQQQPIAPAPAGP